MHAHSSQNQIDNGGYELNKQWGCEKFSTRTQKTV